MVAKKETAEQKLLKMIETTSGGSSAPVSAKKSFLSKQSFVAVIKSVNKILMVGVIISGLFLANQLKNGIELLGKSVRFNVNQQISKQSANPSNLIPNVQKLSFYLAAIDDRNIFQPYDSAGSKSVVEVSGKNQHIAQKTSHLRLVGISWLDTVDSASAMVEDSNKKMTYFLQSGEKLGDITVKTIYADSVKLGYENEEIIIQYDKSQM